MPRKLVTCPETASPAHIEYEEHPLGLLVTSCSRFAPGCWVACGRTCISELEPCRGNAGDLDDEEVTQVDIDRMITQLRVS